MFHTHQGVPKKDYEIYTQMRIESVKVSSQAVKPNGLKMLAPMKQSVIGIGRLQPFQSESSYEFHRFV